MLTQGGTVEVDMHVDAARRGNEALAIANRRCRAADQRRVNGVHYGRITGLGERDHSALLDAKIALANSKYRIDEHDIAQKHVERAHGTVIARHQTQPVAKRLAAAMQALIALEHMVVFDLRQERRITQADRITRGRSVHRGIVSPVHPGHGSSSLYPRSRARRSARSLIAGSCREPSVKLFNPPNSPVPPNSISLTSLLSPGSKRTAVPAGTASRLPKDAPRSNSSARLVSKKW